MSRTCDNGYTLSYGSFLKQSIKSLLSCNSDGMGLVIMGTRMGTTTSQSNLQFDNHLVKSVDSCVVTSGLISASTQMVVSNYTFPTFGGNKSRVH